MEIKLNKNSWHFKYYSFVISNQPPKTLCPYFWSVVLIMVLSPFILIITALGYVAKLIEKFAEYIGQYFGKKEKELTLEDILKINEKRRKNELFWLKFTNFFAKFVRWGILPIATCALLVLLVELAIEIGPGLFVGGLLIILLCLVGLLSTIIYLVDNSPNLSFLNPFNWKVSKILGEMINAYYVKACPIITWEEEIKTI